MDATTCVSSYTVANPIQGVWRVSYGLLLNVDKVYHTLNVRQVVEKHRWHIRFVSHVNCPRHEANFQLSYYNADKYDAEYGRRCWKGDNL